MTTVANRGSRERERAIAFFCHGVDLAAPNNVGTGLVPVECKTEVVSLVAQKPSPLTSVLVCFRSIMTRAASGLMFSFLRFSFCDFVSTVPPRRKSADHIGLVSLFSRHLSPRLAPDPE